MTHSRTHTPVLKLIPKSDVLVKKVVVRRNIALAKETAAGGSSIGMLWAGRFLASDHEADQGQGHKEAKVKSSGSKESR